MILEENATNPQTQYPKIAGSDSSKQGNEEVNETTVETLTNKILSLKEKTEHNFIEMGRLLIKVKEILGHGKFLTWLKNNIEMSTRTAHRFMSVAKANEKSSSVANLGYSKACVVLSLLPSGKKIDEEEKYKEIEKFMADPHIFEDNTSKTVIEMSKRELQKAVDEYKHRRTVKDAPNKPKSSSTETTTNTNTSTETNENVEETFSKVLSSATSCVDKMVIILDTLKNDSPDMYQVLFDKVTSFLQDSLSTVDPNGKNADDV